MKRSWLYLLVCLFGISSITSCSEEYDEDDVPTIGTEYNASYLGTLTYILPGQSKVEVPQKVFVQKSRDERVDIRMENLRWPQNSYITITLKDVIATLTDMDSPLALSTEQTVQNEDIPFTSDVKLDGDITDGLLSLSGICTFSSPEDMGEVSVTFTGVRQEEEVSSSALITSFDFSNAQTIDGGVRIFSNLGEIRISMNKDASGSDFKKLIPIIELSPGATIEPAGGIAQDFTKPVLYTVTSQDKVVSRTYEVTLFSRPKVIDFESWIVANPSAKPAEQYQLPAPTDSYLWSNLDASFARFMSFPIEPESEFQPAKPSDRWSVIPSSDSHSGTWAAQIETLRLRDNKYFYIPAIRSGMLYTGSFKEGIGGDTYQNMHLGFPIHYAPIAIKGEYKFKRGITNYECIDYKEDFTEVYESEAPDECLIRVVLFEVTDRLDDEQMLTLESFMDDTTSNIVALGELRSSKEQLTYAPFNIELEYREDKPFSYRNEYRLAILCTSSSAGYRFSGAPGSTLWVDHIEVETE